MSKLDKFEKDILKAYESGELVSTKPTKEEKEMFKAAAQATSLKDRRVNIRLSSPDLRDIQSRALEEGVPYQTLIASVLHKYVSGRFVEKQSRLTTRRADGINGLASRKTRSHS
jgi:predicted DNA binding CopG/RHH family protein